MDTPTTDDRCKCGGEPYSIWPTDENEPWFKDLLKECPPEGEEWAYFDGVRQALFQAAKDGAGS